MSRLVQALAAAAPADAVTGQALAWQRLLEAHGHRSVIVAEHVHPSLGGLVRRLDAGGDRMLRNGAVVLHYSVASATVDAALNAPGPLAVCYHNITPGHLLRDANPALAAACDRARESLAALRGRARAILADSEYNAQELRDLGLEATVVPLLLDLPAPPGPRARSAGPAPIILSVGRIVPNKRWEDVISSFALYQRHRAPQATLEIVGGADGFERYLDALRGHVARLGARGVIFRGRVGDDERDRLYARADAYLCMSVHEGFCAPLVEAMAHGVPVVARRAGAVAETLGGGGLALEVDDGLALVAEALHEVVTDERTRQGLRAGARRRLADLDPAVVGPKVLAGLAPVLGAGT